jgi:hypothetical protein
MNVSSVLVDPRMYAFLALIDWAGCLPKRACSGDTYATLWLLYIIDHNAVGSGWTAFKSLIDTTYAVVGFGEATPPRNLSFGRLAGGYAAS